MYLNHTELYSLWIQRIFQEDLALFSLKLVRKFFFFLPTSLNFHNSWRLVPEVGLKLCAAALRLLQWVHTEEENNSHQALKMPRSFLVKKYFTSKKPNYSELESQNGKRQTFPSLYKFILGGLAFYAECVGVYVQVF